MHNQLEVIRSNILDRIEEITMSPKPNYNIDGQTVSWQSYLDSLFGSLTAIDERLRIQSITNEPFEEITSART